MSYLNEYSLINNSSKKWKENIEEDMKNLLSGYLTNNNTKSIIIGNMLYGIANGRVSYCYISDYRNGNKTFYPIWDKDCSCEYGWSEFEDCCRIYDMIKKHIDAK